LPLASHGSWVAEVSGLRQIVGALAGAGAAPEHGEAEDGDDDKHQQGRHQHHPARVRLSAQGDHVVTPVLYITAMLRVKLTVGFAVCPGCPAIGFTNVSVTCTDRTWGQRLPAVTRSAVI